MQTSKLIAKIFYGISKLFAVFYALIFMYSGFCLLTGNRVKESEDGNMLHILYPFFDSKFMNIDDNLPYKIFSFMLPIGLYALFFYLASNMFQVFFQNRLFTKKNIKQLNWFYRYNLFLPLPITILSSFFVEISGSVWMLVFVHFILGILTYFLAQIFKQGLGLQDEQDLFIWLMAIIVNIDVMLAKRKMLSKELAEIIGITPVNLSILKTGKAKGIRFETLDAICKALECQPGDILEYSEDWLLTPFTVGGRS